MKILRASHLGMCFGVRDAIGLALAQTEPSTILGELVHNESILDDLRSRGVRTNKIPFIQSWASWPLILTSLIIVAVGAWLTVSPLADTLGFVPLPPLFWLYLAIMLLGYAILTQLVKTWFIRRFGE